MSFSNCGFLMNIISWNVKSLNHPIKRKKVFSHLQELKTDIAFLQETHLRISDHARLKNKWIGQIYHSNFNSKSRGAAIIINKNLPFVTSNIDVDPNGRFVIIVGKVYGFPLILANIYAPNWDDSQFFTDVFSRIPNMSSHNIIFGGDLNNVLSSLDRSSQNVHSLSKSASVIRSFLDAYGLADVWRFRNPSSRKYSFFSNVHKTYSRIDYLFLDKKLLPFTTDCDYKAIVISDHSPLTLSLQIPNVNCNYRPWRLNTMLLAEEEFTNYIRSQIDIFVSINQTPEVSHSTVWESLKAYLRGQIISYCAKRKKETTKRLTELADQIVILDATYSINPSPTLYKHRLQLQSEYNLLSTKQAEYLLSKSRSYSYEHGEKMGRLLAQQLRQRTANQAIPEINNEQGIKCTENLEINNSFLKYYQNLYSCTPTSDYSKFDNFFKNLEVPSLKTDISSGLEEPISDAEIQKALTSLQCGKSPGPDGFPTEFYKIFAPQIIPLLKSTYYEAFGSQSLPPTMRQAVISLILKKDKDNLNCSSYRPISLLNVDTKILSKVLAHRLEKILPSLISPDQTGFIKNRFSFFNIRRLLNIIYYRAEGNESETVISLDAEKAFDRVRWDFLFYTLTKFGFKNNFISWIKVLYSSPLVAVRTNNNLSKYFELQCGTRQGCPLLPLLFALVIEPLAIALRQHTDIIGIRRGETEHRVSLYADDMLLYIKNPSHSLPKVLNLLKAFGTISSYKINFEKSEAMPIGSEIRQSYTDLHPFKISYDKFKYLGIWITRSFKDLYKANFQVQLSKLKQDLAKWELLPHSLGGRINTIKMNVFPKFLYLFQCLPIFLTKSFFKNLNSQISTFIWNKKPPRLKQRILQRPRSAGGLALPNFLFYYWASNIKAMLYWTERNENSPSWVVLEKMSVENVTLESLLCTRLPLQKAISTYTSNPLVLHSIKIWNQFRRHFKLTEMSLVSPPLRHCMFVPSLTDEAFSTWMALGITSLYKLFSDNVFCSFEQLKIKYHIPGSHFFRYLQIRNFIICNLDCFPSAPSPTLLDNIFKIKLNTKGLISIIYNLLNKHKMSTLLSVKDKWERDLCIQISEEIWKKIIDRIFSSSICLRHVVIQFKVVHRLHWSKTRLSQIKQSFDPTCDRCKQEPASLLHMFWTCSKLQNYWKNIFDVLAKACGVILKPCAFIAIFGVNVDGRLTKDQTSLIAFSTIMARRRILLNWKNAQPPAYGHWVRDVMYHIQLEKIRCTLKGSVQKFYDVWKPFLCQFENIEATDIAI